MNSEEIGKILISNGCELVKPNKHGYRYVHPSVEHPLYLKKRTWRGNFVPVKTCPLVLHPKLKSMSAEIDQIDGLVVDWNTQVHNTAYTGFPKRIHTGTNPISYGYAASCEHEQSLVALLRILGVKGPAAARSDAFTDIRNARTQLAQASDTTREAIVAARLGQGKFRQSLFSIWNGCAVTGLTQPEILRASHIKPWRDSDNRERLDPNNGLLLAANLDAAFDSGLITFSATGAIVISSAFKKPEECGISRSMRLRSLPSMMISYLNFHRENVFIER